MFREDKKIGYLALVIGLVALGQAWFDILGGKTGTLDYIFLGTGLIASLSGIALIIQRAEPPVKE